jgi:endo-1,4-beta-D-glucanase Y
MKATAPIFNSSVFALFACIAAVGCAAAGEGGAGQAGTTGSAGTTGAGGTAPSACGPQTPAPAANGAAYPFPQHRLSPNCGYPTNCTDADVQMSWAQYKQRMIVSAPGGMRVQRTENGNDTVSEGIAYGMLMAVYMADKPAFDGLWGFAKAHRNGKGLMSWHLNPDSSVASGGSGAASDADEDMGFALVMADKQWGGYAAEATTQINAILNNEVSSSNVFLPDDSGNQNTDVNPSYFSPAFYRVFQTHTNQARWGQVVDQTYVLLNRCANATTGLVPDWCIQSSGAPSSRGMNYSYDATRTPLRIALDACWNNEARAISYLAKISAFFQGVGGPNIKDGYNVNGTATGMYLVPAFAGPAGASAMPGKVDPFLRDTYARVAVAIRTGTSSAYNYYNASVGLLTLMLMTGNFINLAGL